MDFSKLYSLVNEIPHLKIPDGVHGEVDITIDLDDVSYIDYKVEAWSDVDFELRRSYVDVLTKLNEEGILLTVDSGVVEVVDDYGSRRFNEHPQLISLLQKSNIGPTEFSLAIVTNHDKFEYI